MNKLVLIILFFGSIKSFSQSTTFQALLNLNHNVDNNKFDLETKPTKEAFGEMKSVIWNNVYFEYFKNPNTMGSQRPDESMKFLVKNQFLYKIYCKSDTVFEINLSKGTKDKVVDVNVVVFSIEGDKMVSSKLKGKNYSLTKEDKNIRLQISQGIIKTGTLLQVLVEIESYNFNKLGPFNFVKPISGDYNFILTANIPEIFRYSIPEAVKLDDKTIESIQLKEFTHSNPPIVDYNAASYSYKWTITSIRAEKELIFRLESINIGKDIGTSVEQLMKTSE